MNIDPWIIAAGAALAFVVLRRVVGRRAPPDVVRARIEAGARIVDVRTPHEFGAGAYPSAVNIPLQTLAARLDEIPTDRPIVVYCASGMRSASATRMLKRAGYADVVNGGGLHHLPR